MQYVTASTKTHACYTNGSSGAKHVRDFLRSGFRNSKTVRTRSLSQTSSIRFEHVTQLACRLFCNKSFPRKDVHLYVHGNAHEFSVLEDGSKVEKLDSALSQNMCNVTPTTQVARFVRSPSFWSSYVYLAVDTKTTD